MLTRRKLMATTATLMLAPAAAWPAGPIEEAPVTFLPIPQMTEVLDFDLVEGNWVASFCGTLDWKQFLNRFRIEQVEEALAAGRNFYLFSTSADGQEFPAICVWSASPVGGWRLADMPPPRTPLVFWV